MKILIDTNRIIAALVKESTTRSILMDETFQFVTPDFTLTEINEHKEEMKQKTKLSQVEFEMLLMLIFEHISIIPHSEYNHYIKECQEDRSDPDDLPQLAAGIATKAEGIWSHDPHFREQKKMKVFTNIDLLRISGKIKF